MMSPTGIGDGWRYYTLFDAHSRSCSLMVLSPADALSYATGQGWQQDWQSTNSWFSTHF